MNKFRSIKMILRFVKNAVIAAICNDRNIHTYIGYTKSEVSTGFRTLQNPIFIDARAQSARASISVSKAF